VPPSRPPGLDRPGVPGAAAPILRRSWPVLAAVVVVALVVAGLAGLSRSGDSAAGAGGDRVQRCEPLTGPLPDVRLPAALPALPGQFVHQLGQVDQTVFTFTAVPNPDLDGVLAELTGALRTAGYTVTVTRPLAAVTTPTSGDRQTARQAVLTVAGPAGRGTVTVAPRCATQTAVAYVLTPP
jgi:hypothetical protein